MKTFVTSLLAVLCLICSLQSYAEDTVKQARWYQVNLTFFQQKSDHSIDEVFDYSHIDLNMSDIIRLYDNQQLSIADSSMNALLALHHENVNSNGFSLQNIASDWNDILEKLDPIKQPILYNAQWVQPVYASDFSLPIYFESSQQIHGISALKGLLKLHVSRFLHTELLFQFMPKQASSANDLISLQQNRRMRSKEVHYIDHPYIGVLVRIIPKENPLTPNELPNETDIPSSSDHEEESVLNTRL